MAKEGKPTLSPGKKSPPKGATPENKAQDIKQIQQSPQDPLGSLQANLRDAPLPEDGLEPIFDRDGPQMKKVRRTYFL